MPFSFEIKSFFNVRLFSKKNERNQKWIIGNKDSIPGDDDDYNDNNNDNKMKKTRLITFFC